MKTFFLLLFSGSLVLSQAQATINLNGNWCDAEMYLSADLTGFSEVNSWFLNGEKLEGETGATIDCHKYGAGTYSIEIAQDYSIVTSIYELSTDEVPAINFSAANYPAAAVTIFENITIAGEEIASVSWDFGNGETSSLSKAQVFYKAEQEYTIRLTVITVSGCKYTIAKKHEWSYN